MEQAKIEAPHILILLVSLRTDNFSFHILNATLHYYTNILDVVINITAQAFPCASIGVAKVQTLNSDSVEESISSIAPPWFRYTIKCGNKEGMHDFVCIACNPLD